MKCFSGLLLAMVCLGAAIAEDRETGNAGGPMASRQSQSLEAALRRHGWLVFSAKILSHDWDLYRMRPDGSDRRKLTDSREYNEVGVRFSPDGAKVLYYRLPRAEAVDNNTYGTFELVIANADGTGAESYGRGFSWASWGPDSRQLACLTLKGIQVIDLESRAVVRVLPRKGIVSQLVWSPDGQSFIGTANGLGPFWNIGHLQADSGVITAVSETERYNCTPDWLPDSRAVVYARGIIPQEGGRAELWVGRIDIPERRHIYAEPDRHIYGACVSPDGAFVVFTRSIEDLGKVDHTGTAMSVIRWPETGPSSVTSNATPLRLDLGPGWEPHWTLKERGAGAAPSNGSR